MTTLLLIRHAENDFMKRHRLAGWLPDIHLNERGRAQAQALAETLGPIRIKAIYTSPLERAVETAQPLARSRHLPLVRRGNLGEIRYGEWQGRSLRSLSRQKLWSLVQRSPSQARFPGGETLREAQARIVGELDLLAARHPGPKAVVACFSHADPIKLALSFYLGQPMDLFQRLTIEPASVSALQIADGRVRILSINDARAARDAGGG